METNERRAFALALKAISNASDCQMKFDKAKEIGFVLAEMVEKNYGNVPADTTILALYMVMTSMAEVNWRCTEGRLHDRRN